MSTSKGNGAFRWSLRNLTDPWDEQDDPPPDDPGKVVAGGAAVAAGFEKVMGVALLTGSQATAPPPQEDGPWCRHDPPSPCTDRTGRIILRTRPGLTNHDAASLQELAAAEGLVALEKLLTGYGVEDSPPLVEKHFFSDYVETGTEVVLSQEKGIGTVGNGAVAKSGGTPLDLRAAAFERRLERYWRIGVGHQPPKKQSTLLMQLNALADIETAYFERTLSDPGVTSDPYCGGQAYLDPAPVGIDARWAWQQLPDDATWPDLVDLEQGWMLDHEDVTARDRDLLCGENRHGVGGYLGHHGTAVLGIVAAPDQAPGEGVVGIAHGLRRVRLASHFSERLPDGGNLVQAIAAAALDLAPGDILLVEVQAGGLPVEVDDHVFDAIREAVDQGVIVIEAAGNGGFDLDTFAGPNRCSVLNPHCKGYRASGAVLVGAAAAELPHERCCFSNYGARVDCHAWGSGVVTCGYGDFDDAAGNDNASYTARFGGTSAAAAIIAGAAALLQALHLTRTGARLSPAEMRRLLRHHGSGTAAGGAVPGHIGPMPDLRRIITGLGLADEVYVRDHVLDPHLVGADGRLFASPDIVAVAPSLADPAKEYGEGSGTENRDDAGIAVDPRTPCGICVRMHNRGLAEQSAARATLYWTEATTLPIVGRWHEIGTTGETTVPAGDVLVVSDPVRWERPVDGTCLVAHLGPPEDVSRFRPSSCGELDWQGWVDYLQRQDRIAVRNLHLLDPAKPEFVFMIAGAPDQARRFSLEVRQSLPAGWRVLLELPSELGRFLVRGRLWDVRATGSMNRLQILLPARPQLGIADVPFARNVEYRACVRVVPSSSGPATPLGPGHGLAIRQFYGGAAVGGITWRFRG